MATEMVEARGWAAQPLIGRIRLSLFISRATKVHAEAAEDLFSQHSSKNKLYIASQLK